MHETNRCPVSRKLANLTHHVGSHAGRRPMRQVVCQPQVARHVFRFRAPGFRDSKASSPYTAQAAGRSVGEAYSRPLSFMDGYMIDSGHHKRPPGNEQGSRLWTGGVAPKRRNPGGMLGRGDRGLQQNCTGRRPYDANRDGDHRATDLSGTASPVPGCRWR